MATIHPSAIVDDGAAIDDNVFIGPYCMVGPNVHLHNGVQLLSHVVIDGQFRLELQKIKGETILSGIELISENLPTGDLPELADKKIVQLLRK